jgi:spermidine synthase
MLGWMLGPVFALSGAAALVFETLFFRLAGLALGNSVHAAALVLFSFMTGLGLGNALAASAVRRFGRPLLLFAVLETVIGLYGAALVFLFPAISAASTLLLRPLAEAGPALEITRLGLAFALFVVPAFAMGMTLPVLVSALLPRDPNFGSTLGRLYGWNTAGAVVGALLAERVLVTHLGVSGAGVVAASLDLLAVAAVLWLRHGRLGDTAYESKSQPRPSWPDRSEALLLAAAFLCGGALLALEVVWFRFFLLFTSALSWNLALMLATVLAGIASGGFAAAAWFRRRDDAHRHVASVTLLCGASVTGLYTTLCVIWPRVSAMAAADAYLILMFPVSLLSGMIFTLLGRAIEARGTPAAVATGRLALANTAGAAVGSLAGGFLLIPVIGVEPSFVVVAVVYGIAAILLVAASANAFAARVQRGAVIGAALAYAVSLALFPSGALEQRLLGLPGSVRSVLTSQGYELAAYRETVTETIQYFRKPLLGVAHHHILATNNFPMAGTPVSNRRYMKAYVYWPVAVNPELRSALLISYGTGETARALAATAGIERIDVVDISAEILELSRLVAPASEPHPLDDPRVHVHIEDGRFFLQTTDRRFDLITGEPPPPRHAGVGNLYSREYFALVRDRLEPGGIVTYWLSAHQLRLDESRAVLRGFCDVFPNCSLWSGNGLEWMMVAVHEPGGPASDEDFSALWRDRTRSRELFSLGFPNPGTLAATFIADGERLARFIGDAPPLVDDFPQRIASRPVEQSAEDLRAYREFMADPAALENLASSPMLARYWPAGLRRSDPALARARKLALSDLWERRGYAVLYEALTDPDLAAYAPWAVASDADALQILAETLAARPDSNRELALSSSESRHLAAAALLRRDFESAERALAAWQRGGARRDDFSPDPGRSAYLVAVLRLLGGDDAGAARLLAAQPRDAETESFRSWAASRFESVSRGEANSGDDDE